MEAYSVISFRYEVQTDGYDEGRREKSGVAPITVSRVLNNPGSVASATKKKVMKAIEELNFKPNQIARSMITRRTNTIGCFCRTLRIRIFRKCFWA
ncbi:LacI family DNA-binding transcriptional regulator [Cohnella faecalis]|uniref:LacI family transcriptional regulator n=1 Tax=Cohnella faecalis TaxID=2315694 RepID=A0A398CXC4_9BACL|nr:LacI family transcriptional regulator [Cohnella faecalis]